MNKFEVGEKVSFLYKIKRKLTYAFAIRGVSKVQSKANKFSILEIGTGSGYFLSSTDPL